MKKTTPIKSSSQEPDIIALAQSYINGDKEITGLSKKVKNKIFTQLEAKVQRLKIEFDQECDKLENNPEARIALGLWVEKLSMEKELSEEKMARLLGSLISRLSLRTPSELLPLTERESELKSLTALASSPKNEPIFAPADTVIKAQKNLEDAYGLLRKLEVTFGLKTAITKSFLMTSHPTGSKTKGLKDIRNSQKSITGSTRKHKLQGEKGLKNSIL